MPKLILSEMYTSVQGEGPRTGTPTIFVRFAGCNMRCPGWPCDTLHAIEPSIWRFDSERLTGLELAEKIRNEANQKGTTNICLTGGEPFLQNGQELYEAISALAHPTRPYSFEVFTNGSFSFPQWTKEPLINMHFNMDWKLLGSGEADTARDVRRHNALWLEKDDVIKFVVGDSYDLDEAYEVARTLSMEGFKGSFWLGRVWDSEVDDQDLLDFMSRRKLPWKLNVQLHKYIWHPDERGV